MRVVNSVINNNGDYVSFTDFSNEYFTYHKTTGTSWANYFTKAKNNLRSLLTDSLGIDEQNFINELLLDFDLIIKATPQQIPFYINKYSTGEYLNTLNSNDVFRKSIETAYDYKAFRKSAKASWYAERFEIRACLYCNAQFTLAIGKDGTKKKLLFQLDHFYSKSDYPFLSLTLGNLIPSCSSCNISKSKTPFGMETHLHPFVDDISSKFSFYINEENALQYLIEKKNKNLLTPYIETSDSRFKNHMRIFNIEEIHKKHTDIIEELVLKSLYYNSSKRDELINEFEDIGLSTSVVDRFILGNYSLKSEINKRPLSKLSSDIGRQLKIIK